MPNSFRPSIRRAVTLTVAAAVVTSLAAVLPATPSTAASAALAPYRATVATVAAPAAASTGPLFELLGDEVDLPATLDGLVRRVDPSSYLALHLDQSAVAARMARGAGTVLALPTPEGGTQKFTIKPVRTMEDGLAAAHPEIRTYSGVSASGAPSTIRLDSTVSGVHAMVVDGQDAWFVEPAYEGIDQGADALYLSYRMSALPEPSLFGEPELSGKLADQYDAARSRAKREQAAAARRAGEESGGPVIMREYRLAMTTDPTYAAKLVGTQVPIDEAHMDEVNEIVTGAKVTLVNRINQIYNADVAFNLVLVDGNDKLNLNTTAMFSGADGPCGAAACFTNSSDCSDVLDTNEPVVGQIIGADNFDIGHLSMGEGFGGVAYLGVVGEDMKAGGCTSLTTPFGDGFAIDFVAHEMGHQFSGNHTFDGVSGSCMLTNRNAETSVEPGSGTSVMAYAGICFSDDTQPHTDPYFSQRTQDEFTARATAAATQYSEEQKYVLRSFDATDSFTLTFPGSGAGSGTTAVIANGTTYTTAALDTAITAVAGGNPTVSALTATGFTVTWADTADHATPTVDVVSGAFSGFGNAIVNGGPGTNQGSTVATGPNHAPTVTAPPTRTIPIRTPFELTGSGADADGDPLIYLWEQNDPGSTAVGNLLIAPLRVFGPLFRVFGSYANVPDATTSPAPGINLATTSPTRTFPDIEQIIAGSTNAATGLCPAPSGVPDPTVGLPNGPALECYSELLPMAGYLGREGNVLPSLTMRLTGRDNGGADGGVDGGVGHQEVVLDVDPTAGPFLVSSQGTATTVAGNAAGTISWDTARTDLLGLADDVRITLSTDGGRTYPITLLETTPNDGDQAITWPNVATTKARVKVAAVDNYFFDINDADITIDAVPGLTLGGNTPGTFTTQHSDTPAPTPVVTASSATVDGDTIAATAAGLPAGLGLTKVASSAAGVRPGTARFEVTGTPTGDAGTFPVSVEVTDGAATAQTTTFTVEVTKETAAVTYTGPAQATAGTGGTDAVQVTLAADVTEQADGSLGGLTATTATFTDTVSGETLCSAPVTAAKATCDFGADLTGTADRTYQVAVTLGGQRYTGATIADSPLAVRYDTSLVVSGPAAASAAQYTDALDPALTVDVSDRFVESGAITATATGLPSGLAVTRTAASAAGVLPGTATYAVTGTVTGAPGSYPVTIRVADGEHADVTKQVTITVTREDASVTYTGPSTVPAAAADTTKQFTMTARVTDLGSGAGNAGDTTVGDVTTATVTFRDTATSTVLCADAPVVLTATGVGTAACSVTATLPADDDRTYRVALSVGGRYSGTSTADAPVVVDQAEEPTGDTTPPQTSITAGPKVGQIVLSRDVTFGYASSEPNGTFTCTLSGVTGACPGTAGASTGSSTGRGLRTGSYDFKVAATDAAGNTDATPSTRRFYIPTDDRVLSAVRGPWLRKSSADTYRRTYTTVAKKGSELRFQMTPSRSITLVVTRGRAYGSVDVYLGSKKLRTVDLKASAERTQVLVPVVKFSTPTSGLVRIVTRTDKPVRIEGLAATAVAATSPQTRMMGGRDRAF